MMSQPNPAQKNTDVEAQMIEQLQILRNQNQLLKTEKDRLQKLLDEVTCSNDGQRSCECGRKLRYISAQLSNNAKFCSKCEKPLEQVSSVWWACQSCNYNACVNCEGYKKSVCPFSHFLQYKKYNQDIEMQQQLDQQALQLKSNKSKSAKQCDICKNKIVKNYYVCTCGFDMCQKCKNK